ncbi:hypothetical protein D9M68_931470 [compost metagenome]
MQPANETLLGLYDDHDRRVALAQAPRPAATRTSSAAKPREQAKQNPIKRLWNNIFNN